MNITLIHRLVTTLLISSLLGFLPAAGTETASPLDSSQHPESAEHVPVFPAPPLPLDTRLSWTERFNGDETFNPNEVLPPIASSLPADSDKSMAMGSGGMDARGVIKGLRPDQAKVKIAHGTIDKYGMPAMTMMFKVENPALLQGLKNGQQVGFNIDNSSGGFVLTGIMPMPAEGMNNMQAQTSAMDASGEVETVRASQGKVKIKHGPIDKYGMPAMTMMFKVADPEMLAGLRKNQKIDFNIDNASGGFVVTQIRPKSQMDAKGVVEAVRSDQGKVKIKHGPIDKYGMPAMTMMFKVSDPAQLSGLQKGNDIEFNIDNSSGGFVITKVVAANSAGAGSAQSGLCFSTGPFKEKNRALAVRDRYAANSIKSEMNSSSEKIYVGTIVYLPGHASRQEAQKTVEALMQKGIRDFLIINETGKSNAVSLGVFGSPENAERRMREIRKLNYPVKSEPRYRQGNVYWLDSQGSSASELNSLLASGDSSNGIRQKPRQCA
ncbi:copper-binding protein [Gammaproteobacteria bacterium]|nr:copper-binding protein [Gammaproteobacteria bacterium]